MDRQKTKENRRDRFIKLSLRKNRVKVDEKAKKLNRSSDVIILDESFDHIRSDLPQQVITQPKVYSPIVISDSSEVSSEDLPNVSLATNKSSTVKRKPDNDSINCSRGNISLVEIVEKDSRPSVGGWSPAQNILCATPKHQTIPTTPQDTANTSLEQCSMKEIEKSHKKVLDELYGEAWKSISTKKLFKKIKDKYDNFDTVSKKLQFFDDEESDKENIRNILDTNKKLYLTGSDAKHKTQNYDNVDRKSKKKLYTEKVPATPAPPKPKPVRTRNASTTVKKKKGMSVTELVDLMRNNFMSNNDDNFDSLSRDTNSTCSSLTDTNDHGVMTKKVKGIDLVTKLTNDVTKTENNVNLLARKFDDILKTNVNKTPETVMKRLTFVGSLSDNVPTWRCHVEALQYHDNYKTLREQLARRLYVEFNGQVFGDQLDSDMIIVWDGKLRTTAGTTTNRLVKTSKGDRIRTSSIKLSSKVVDAPQRLRDTLIHELCHAATWLIDGELRAGHGPLWKKWATRALRVYPELGDISRCHNLEIHFKYTYKCNQCGYSIQRHSKSIDVTKKCCGYCRGTFGVVVNKKKKDGVVVSTPARKGGMNEFAQFVKDHYASYKDGRPHAEVMKVLGAQFSARKNKVLDAIPIPEE